eukprot:TRINITY_DN39768_c0_g1_i1.p1 TRINITY_DN39768_c0_g1~~TRINITY_DN39768_c0_g1_i1.p1  ORF type:complete len:473 (+),score=40.92 TRINITY_DN39768_c0_g1_i1:23-1420(+)
MSKRALPQWPTQNAWLDLRTFGDVKASPSAGVDVDASFVWNRQAQSSQEAWTVLEPFDLPRVALQRLNSDPDAIRWLVIKYDRRDSSIIARNPWVPTRSHTTCEDVCRRAPCLAAQPLPKWLWTLRSLIGLTIESYPFTTLPDDIGKLRQLRRLCMYGSNLHMVPQSIGLLTELQELDLYTSYGLHYLPYEVIHCTSLRTSRFSTRALYNNCKNGLPLPELPAFPSGRPQMPWRLLCVLRRKLPAAAARSVFQCIGLERCSVCRQRFLSPYTCFTWCYTLIATDCQALLARCCSASCVRNAKDRKFQLRKSDKNKISKRKRLEMQLTFEQEHLSDVPPNLLPSVRGATSGETTSATKDLSPACSREEAAEAARCAAALAREQGANRKEAGAIGSAAAAAVRAGLARSEAVEAASAAIQSTLRCAAHAGCSRDRAGIAAALPKLSLELDELNCAIGLYVSGVNRLS